MLGIILCLYINNHPVGGDTLWADMSAAYDNLPDHIKEKMYRFFY
ncbi:TauD/TfdA family dioxygenase [Neobacillus bataviensis]